MTMTLSAMSAGIPLVIVLFYLQMMKSKYEQVNYMYCQKRSFWQYPPKIMMREKKKPSTPKPFEKITLNSGLFSLPLSTKVFGVCHLCL